MWAEQTFKEEIKMRINHNIASLNTYRQLSANSAATGKSLEKLSSGLRINRAGDDAAGLAISEKMRGQVRGLEQASRNSQDAISLIQTAEGALNETHDILQRMRELATQASSDTNTASDRGEIQKEINSLTSEINRIGNTTEFNTQKLLNGEKSTATSAVAPSQVTLGGLTFDFSGGSELNGYTIKTGVVTDTTAATATIDTTNKVITLNGDFDNATTAGMITSAQAKTAIDTALSGAGFSQTVTTGGTAVTGTLTNVSSAALAGGADAGTGLQFQIGANENQSLTLEISDMRAVALGISATSDNTAGFTNGASGLGVTNGTNNTGAEYGLDVSTATSAASAITKIQSAIDEVSAERSKLGANQNRLEHTINNLGTSAENLTAAESRIRDVDMAKEMMEFTKNNILSQAAQSMLAQSNQQPSGVLQILR
jgi:flagellin